MFHKYPQKSGVTIRPYSRKFPDSRLFGSEGGGGVFCESTGIRENLGDFSGIRLSGTGKRELFWNKNGGV